MTALRDCRIGDRRVCLGRSDIEGACCFCLRQQARDAYRAGVLSFEDFRSVLASTMPAGFGRVS